jgi:HAD superfamily hydrolase (TIGR01509 family)
VDEQVFLDRVKTRPELEAVVFDAGGTLVRIDFEWMSGMLAELGVHASADELRRAEVHGRRRYDALAGRAPKTPATGQHPPLGSVGPSQAYFAGMLEAAGCRHPVLEEALERVRGRQTPPSFLWARPMEGARHALDALAAMGMRMCCVSNSDGRAERHLEEFGVRSGLEFVVDSQIEGVEKPDPRILEIALAKLGLPAARTVYVGDIRSVDEAGARAAGMHFVLVDPFGDYAAPGQLAVRRMEELPALLASHFTLVPVLAERGRRSATPTRAATRPEDAR